MRSLLTVLLWLPLVAFAHQQSTSYSSWQVADGSVRVVARFAQADLTRARLHPQAPGYPEAVARYVGERAMVSLAGVACTAAEPGRAAMEDGWVRVQVSWQCAPGEGPLALAVEWLFAVAPNHVHLAAIRAADGQVHSRVFRAGRAEWSAAVADGEPGRGFGTYLRLGMHHILEGWDHLCFLLALVLFVRDARMLLWLVTGFTLGHSLTLASAVTGWVIPAPRAVEWVIALSILVLAMENAWREEQRQGAWPLVVTALVLAAGVAGGAVGLATAAGLALFLCAYLLLQRDDAVRPVAGMAATFAFGLFHGFGFAGVLAELTVPTDALWHSLLGFNLGVEAGQLLVLVLAWPAILLLRRAGRMALHLPNALASGAACYWLVQRTLG